MPQQNSLPRLAPLGIDGMLVVFGERLGEAANRAAIAFRAYLEAEAWDGVEETSTALASAFLRFDPRRLGHDDLRARLDPLLTQDWASEAPRGRRRRWTVPAAFGGEAGPQLGDAAEAVGVTEAEAVAQLTAAPLRALAIGYAPGQPYLGTLPEAWDIPRLGAITPNVPAGALVVAVRQMIVFTAATPTGWRHVAQTNFRTFRPEDPETPFAMSAGDEMQVRAIEPDELARLREAGEDGAELEWLE